MTTPTITNILHQLESTPDLLHDNWCVPRETGRFLSLMVLVTQATRICEIGTSIGYSTLWLAQAASRTGGVVDTLEYFEQRQALAKSNIEAAGLSSLVHFHFGDALGTLSQFHAAGKTFDLVFIDAAKKEYLSYVKSLEPMLSAGALLIADNTRSHREEMLDFLNYMEQSTQFDIAEIESPNGQLVARKR